MTDKRMTDDRITSALDAQPPEGTLAEVDGAWVLTMTREYPHPPEKLWAMLTDPALLARWSPVVPDRPLDTVGPARAQESPDMPEVDAEVVACEPARLLVHRWGSQLLRWTLTPTATGTPRATATITPSATSTATSTPSPTSTATSTTQATWDTRSATGKATRWSSIRSASTNAPGCSAAKGCRPPKRCI